MGLGYSAVSHFWLVPQLLGKKSESSCKYFEYVYVIEYTPLPPIIHFNNNCYIAKELSLLNLTNKLHSVTAWHQLGIQLEVPPHKLEEIEQSHSRIDRRMSEVLNYWWRNCLTEKRSWQTIANALKLTGYRNLAEELENGHESLGISLMTIITLY